MFKFALIAALLSTVVAGPIADPIEHQEEARACTVPANLINNPGFESTALAPWTFRSTYQTGTSTGTIVAGGASSAKSFLFSSYSIPKNDNGNVGYLSQVVPVCNTQLYTLSWAFFQGEGGTTWDPVHPFKPFMGVQVNGPDKLQYLLANIDFDKNSYNISTFGNGHQTFKGKPAGKWTTYTAEFPKPQVGNWTVEFRMYVNSLSTATQKTAVKARVDNVVVKPK